MTVEQGTIMVFARAPQPGRVKTRLIPALGPSGAAELHTALVEHCLSEVSSMANTSVQLWCSPLTVDPFFNSCRERWQLELHAQRGNNLGERMAYAFDSQAGQGPAILVGTDWPGVSVQLLQTALKTLSAGRHEVVLAPARDGGYVLVGMSRPIPGIFKGIPWGGDRVMQMTRMRLREANIQWLELPMQWDVDRPEDLQRLRLTGFPCPEPMGRDLPEVSY